MVGNRNDIFLSFFLFILSAENTRLASRSDGVDRGAPSNRYFCLFTAQVERGQRGRYVERTSGARRFTACRPPFAHRIAMPVRGGHRANRLQRDGCGRCGQPADARGRVVHRRRAQRCAGRHQEEVSVRAGESNPQRQVHTAPLAASGRIQHGNLTINIII